MNIFRKKQGGFTLIELTLVIIVAGILATIATVAFRGESLNVNGQAELLASDIRYIQFLSMTLNTSYRINLLGGNQYSFSSADGATPVIHLSYGGSSVSLQPNMALTWSVNLPNNYILFDRHGVPYVDNSGTALTSSATITLTGSNGSVSIVVAPETGNVSI